MNCVITNGACYIKRNSETRSKTTPHKPGTTNGKPEQAIKPKTCPGDSWTNRNDHDGRGWKG